MSVKPIPHGHRTVTPYLAVKGGVEALEFYKRAFSASELNWLVLPDGRLGHAEFRIGDSVIMLADAFPEYGGVSPKALGGTPVTINPTPPRANCSWRSICQSVTYPRRSAPPS